MTEQIGDGPIDPEYREVMQTVARGLDYIFNAGAEGGDRDVGWALMVFPFNDAEGRCNYISNAGRDDMVELMRRQVERFVGEGNGKEAVTGAIDDRALAALYSQFSEETWRSGWYGAADTSRVMDDFIGWLRGIDISEDYVRQDLPALREAWRRFAEGA